MAETPKETAAPLSRADLRRKAEGEFAERYANKYLGMGLWPEAALTSIPMKTETHRLLRAVAIKRAKESGAGPSVGDVVEWLVERARPDLLREAGALFKRELAKKR
jgi:hypothetical protein